MMEKTAYFSPCRKYRFHLERCWNANKGYALFVGLNPSTADENIDDPTVRRCIRFAESWGYGGLIMCNINPYRSTDPKALYKIVLPDWVSIENQSKVKTISETAGITIAAWGNHGALNNQGYFYLREILKAPYHLGLTKSKQPKHPLYLKATTQPTKFVF